MNLTKSVNQVKESPNQNFVLCLSGGGLRATFFHLGVIRAMKEMDLLNDVSKIYSVSGGSILAAHLNLNWKKYTGSDEDFEEMCQQIYSFGSSDIRGNVVRRWLLSLCLSFPLPITGFLSYLSDRSRILERQYRQLYQNNDISKLGSDGAPDIRILTTSFVRGALSAFSSKGFILYKETDIELFETERVSIAKAVTASSAFPAMFPPVRLTGKEVNETSEKKLPHSPDYLSDGGIFDNLGIDAVIRNDDLLDENCSVVISDASAPFDWKVTSDFSFVAASALRASDILMKRVSEILLEKAEQNLLLKPSAHISISDTEVEGDDALSVDILTGLSNIRTDLDKFNEVEQTCLMEHGYRLCKKQLKARDPQNGQSKTHTYSLGLEKDKVTRIIDKASHRKLRLFNLFDWASQLTLAWVLIVAGTLIGTLIFNNLQQQQVVASKNLEIDAVENEAAKLQREVKASDDKIVIFEADLQNINRLQFDNQAAKEVYFSNFSNFLSEHGIKNLSADELLTLGKSNFAFELNGFPPENLWPNIISTARVLDEFIEVTGYEIEVISAYRTPEYNRAIGGAVNSQHIQFNAIDFNANIGNSTDWSRVLRSIRSSGSFKGGVGVYDDFVHLDSRGFNADWSSSSIAENRVFIQFAGYHRDTMKELAKVLLSNGWLIQGAEFGGERTELADGLSEVRYNSPIEKREAERLAEEISNYGLNLEVKAVQNPEIKPGELEVWIGLK